MRVKLNNYKCPKCKRIIKRRSEKKWIRSMCEDSGNVMTRLMLVKKRKRL
jgi:ribosomal protein L37AE/L43A